MPITFDDTVDTRYYVRGTSLPAPTTFAMSCWALRTSTNQVRKTLFALDDDDTTTPDATLFQTEPDASHTMKLSGYRGGVLQQTTGFSMTANIWHYIVMQVSGAVYTSIHAQVTLNTSNQNFTHATGTIASPTRLRIGNSHVGTETWGGYIAALKMWEAVLTSVEIAHERWYYMPKRTDNLLAWVPLLDPASATIDWSPAAASFSNPGGGQAQSPEGPPISWGPIRRRSYHVVPSVAPDQTFNLGLATETDSTLALTFTSPTDTIFPLGIASEIDLPDTLIFETTATNDLTFDLAPADETDSAPGMTFVADQVMTLNLALETDTTLSISFGAGGGGGGGGQGRMLLVVNITMLNQLKG